jgi:hypothetical protein
MRAPPGCRNISGHARRDDFRLARISSADGEVLWHVTQDSRFLGTVTEVGGGYQATLLALGSSTQTRLFAERVAAARWLATLEPARPGCPSAAATRGRG